MANILYDYGHDSQVRSIHIDPEKGTVTVCLHSYPSEQASERILIAVHFSNVTQVNMLADMRAMKENASAGNVQFWSIAEGAGTSYFYVTHGCLAITSKDPPNLIEQ